MKRGTRSIVVVVCLVIAMAALATHVMADRVSRIPDTEPRAEGGVETANLVKVDPLTSTVVVNQVFTVAIRVEGAVDLASYKFDLTYEPAVVSILDVEDGGFVEANSSLVLRSELGPYEVDADTVRFEAVHTPPGDDPLPGATGSGRLAVVTLKALAVDDGSPLDLGNVRLYDATEGTGTAPGATEDGVVVVGACQDVAITALEFDLPVTVDQEVSFAPTVTGSPPFTYTWDFGDGSPLQTGLGLAPIAHTYDAIDTYTLTLTVENVCPSQDTYTTTVNVQAEPDIVVTPASYALQTNVGETFDRPLTIANVGAGDLGWELEDPAVTWLSAAPLAGIVAPDDSDEVTLSFDATGLAQGETVSTTLVINSNDPDDDPVEVPVSLEVHEDGDGYPDIEVTPTSFSFLINEDELLVKPLTIANVGGASLTWDIDDPAESWLGVAPTSGTLASGGSDEVTVSFDATDWTAGETYTAVLVINSNDPNEDPLEVPIELEVRDDLPDIKVTPASFYVALDVGASENRTLVIENVGFDTLDWALAVEPLRDWLSVMPVASPDLEPGESQTKILTFDATGLTKGDVFTTTLVIATNDPNENPVVVPVTLAVEPCEPAVIDEVVSNTPVKIGEVMEFVATVSGTPPFTYVWDFDDPDGSGTGETTATPTWKYSAVGDYTVTLSVANDCGSDDVTLDVTVEEQTIFLPIIFRNYTP